MLITRGSCMSLAAALFLSGCGAVRWTDQWNSFPRPHLLTREDPQVPTVQAVGLRGYRFGVAGGAVMALLATDTLPIELRDGEAVRVFWLGDPQSFTGHLVGLKRGTNLLIGSADRLALREWQEQALLFEADLESRPQFFVAPVGIVFDLDVGKYAYIPVGVNDYRCVASQARELSQSEIARVTSDLARGRISTLEADLVYQKLAPYLASDPIDCSFDSVEPGERRSGDQISTFP
jgi:hypothetical protein